MLRLTKLFGSNFAFDYNLTCLFRTVIILMNECIGLIKDST